MKEMRSGSQILFGLLPGQTADLRGKIWRVVEWKAPYIEEVDTSALRSAIIRHSMPWAVEQQDGDFVRRLNQQYDLRVVSLSHRNGVQVEPFPQVWSCKSCGRISRKTEKACRCESREWIQIPFVGYHSACGALHEPRLPECPEHREIKIIWPGTSAASEIRFVCPVCNLTIQQGFGFVPCFCKESGGLAFQLHRSASVFTPRTVVVVNPPSQRRLEELRAAGGPVRALDWVLDGMQERRMDSGGKLTAESLLSNLLAQGLTRELAESMVEAAKQSGQVANRGSSGKLTGAHRDAAQEQAFSLALGVDLARRTIPHLVGATDASSMLGKLYRRHYPAALKVAGLETVELVDRFPVLTGNFGYTRGETKPGKSRLVPFQDRRGNYTVYANLAETEALLVRLDPARVAQWLVSRGHALDPWTDATSARLALLNGVIPPEAGDEILPGDPGGDLLGLVHSYAHRLIRRVSVLAGIERSALAEFVVPSHAAFFVYASARGDFVLGGLQAVFEAELDRLLKEVVHGDHRCALDPGCRRNGGACVGCLHLGEPSCRYYNRFLSRDYLHGAGGYLRMGAGASAGADRAHTNRGEQSKEASHA